MKPTRFPDRAILLSRPFQVRFLPLLIPLALLPAAPRLASANGEQEKPAPAAKREAAGVGHEPEFKPRRVVRAFPAIKNPPILEAAKIPKDYLRDNELVLGVQIGKESRAYPINMLTGPIREIINDKLGGRAIAATW